MNAFEYKSYKVKCSRCGREILVEVVLFGINHNANVSAICKECLKEQGLSLKFKEESPEHAKEIQEWLDEGLENAKEGDKK